MRLNRIVTAFCTAMLLSSLTQTAQGDGGQVRISRRTGPYLVTVFTAPTPLRVGRADVSVMIQDPKTAEIVGDVDVRVDMTPSDSARASDSYPATRKQATNKLLQAATVTFPSPGTWTVSIDLQGARGVSHVQFTTDVLAATPPWRDLVPWIAWPLLPIGLFALREIADHMNASARRKRHRPDSTMPCTS